MALVKRANVELSVEDTEVDRYIDLGYVLIDNKGNIIKQGVPSDKLELQDAYRKHVAKIAELEEEIANLKATQVAPKKAKKSE